MAFTLSKKVYGNTVGGLGCFTCSYVNDGGSTGGAIATPFKNLNHFSASNTDATTKVQMTVSTGTVTLTVTANSSGTFMAIGQ
jgi:hypothetical protein